MGKFNGMMVCTDLDGTLLNNESRISAKNKEAIEYFKSEGGIFTFVTGRMPYYAQEYYKAVMPNAPIGCVNGGGVYDYEAEEYIWKAPMDEKVTELVGCVYDKLPMVGIQAVGYYKTYFCRENKSMERFREITRLENTVCACNEVKEPIAKIVFGCVKEREIEDVIRVLEESPLYNDFSYIRSERELYEIIPKGIGKGVSLEKIAKHLNIDINKTVAIGDYNNDISMFKSAKAGIAVANACPEALEAADFITVSNEEDAIAQVISDIECGKYI